MRGPTLWVLEPEGQTVDGVGGQLRLRVGWGSSVEWASLDRQADGSFYLPWPSGWDPQGALDLWLESVRLGGAEFLFGQQDYRVESGQSLELQAVSGALTVRARDMNTGAGLDRFSVHRISISEHLRRRSTALEELLSSAIPVGETETGVVVVPGRKLDDEMFIISAEGYQAAGIIDQPFYRERVLVANLEGAYRLELRTESPGTWSGLVVQDPLGPTVASATHPYRQVVRAEDFMGGIARVLARARGQGLILDLRETALWGGRTGSGRLSVQRSRSSGQKVEVIDLDTLAVDGRVFGSVSLDLTDVPRGSLEGYKFCARQLDTGRPWLSSSGEGAALAVGLTDTGSGERVVAELSGLSPGDWYFSIGFLGLGQRIFVHPGQDLKLRWSLRDGLALVNFVVRDDASGEILPLGLGGVSLPQVLVPGDGVFSDAELDAGFHTDALKVRGGSHPVAAGIARVRVVGDGYIPFDEVVEFASGSRDFEVRLSREFEPVLVLSGGPGIEPESPPVSGLRIRLRPASARVGGWRSVNGRIRRGPAGGSVATFSLEGMAPGDQIEWYGPIEWADGLELPVALMIPENGRAEFRLPSE